MLDENERYYVSYGMEMKGGGFVKALGLALGRADDINALKIKNAFPEYWAEYIEIGKGLHKQVHGD